MEVEKKVGKLDSVNEKPKTKWAILFAVLGVLIVVAIIAIVVVLVSRNNSGNTQDVAEGIFDEEASEKYEEISKEITLKVIEAQEVADDVGEGINVDTLLELLKENIDAAKNERVKAMLAADYYMARLSQNPGEDAKDEIINGLFGVDDILKTSDSAFKVMNAAVYFGDQELADKYHAIGMERAATEDANRGTENDTDNSDSGDEEETVG